MKGCVFVLLLLSVSGHSFCQNLIPNPTFTDVLGTLCYDATETWGPNYYGLIEYAPPWTSPWGTPDLFRPCPELGTFYTVPNNTKGYQYPKVGENYAGIRLHNYAREYLETPLLEYLSTDSIYLVEFYVNKGTITGIFPPDIEGVRKLGVHFSSNLLQFDKSQFPPSYTENIYLSPELVTPSDLRLVDSVE